jgi:hypothetical protein
MVFKGELLPEIINGFNAFSIPIGTLVSMAHFTV